MNELLKKKEVWVGIVVVLLLIVIGFKMGGTKEAPLPSDEGSSLSEEEDALSPEDTAGRVALDSGTLLDVGNMTYTVGGESFTVTNGTVSAPVEGSETSHRLSVLESPAFADVNGDDVRDAVVLLRSEPGGSGIFYYTAVVLAQEGMRTATNEVFLGDRIRIKEISVDGGVISITILTRGEDEPMSAPPTKEETRRFSVSGSTLSEIE